MINVLNIIGQLTFFAFLLYFVFAIWIDKGIGAGIVMLILGWICYPVIARMFPLALPNNRKKR